MSDLRAKLIEAATDEFRRCMAEDELLDQIPVRLLDAFMDCLAENPDEWAEETRVATLVGGDALALIAVLRESDDV